MNVQTFALIMALAILAFASGAIGIVTINLGNGEPQYTIEGQAHLAGKLLEPNIEVQDISYGIRESSPFDFSSLGNPAFNILDVAEDVSCRALLLVGTTVEKSTGFSSMGSFGMFTDKDYAFTLAKVPAGEYTLQVECNWKDGGYNRKTERITVG